ncbi:DUF4268 domain-containing protein [Nocardia sp. NPDC058058]|uniref:DUF4268 domain-containing protein n=1 Tax=Nocardia sp. NPDC058058 TaxID=3346317 RepID=UPI0036DF3663
MKNRKSMLERALIIFISAMRVGPVLHTSWQHLMTVTVLERQTEYCMTAVGVDGKTIGRLEAVNLRSVWAHEAHDFTPWLLANADQLGEALGLELILEANEHPVGGYSLDLIGTAGDEVVIIENQLEETDHSHLGQVLTYAAGTEATNIVWVAARFREEHRAALDWLNHRTDIDTRFFGIEVSAVRIGDSVPAPQFRVVAKPNDWGKTARARTRSEASAAGQLYAEFWDRFLSGLGGEGLQQWTSSRTGSNTKNWLDMPTGRADVVYGVKFSSGGLQSHLYFKNSDSGTNRARLEQLRAVQAKFEGVYGRELGFDVRDGRSACLIWDRAAGKVVDKDKWDSYIRWFIDAQKRLRASVEAVGGIPV